MYKLPTVAFSSLALGIALGFSVEIARLPGSESDQSVGLAARFERVEQAITRLERSARQTAAGVDAGAAVASTFDSTQIEHAIERSVRAELRGALANDSFGTRNTSPEAEPSPSPQNEQAYELAYETVLSAVARRRWSDEDREVVREAMRQLSAAQRQEVAGGLVTAINQGQLEIEPDMLPF